MKARVYCLTLTTSDGEIINEINVTVHLAPGAYNLTYPASRLALLNEIEGSIKAHNRDLEDQKHCHHSPGCDMQPGHRGQCARAI